MALNPTALLIIRAWLEAGSSQPLRARIRLTSDVSSGFTSEVTLSDISEVSANVEAWLRDVMSNAVAGTPSEKP